MLSNNLLETSFKEWTLALDEGFGIDVVFLDYQKAFDTVPHRRLISKLEAYGINKTLLRWLEKFLSSRKIRVQLDGFTTLWAEVLRGVPQGSVLGIILFLIYVNELPELIKSSIKLFADDSKVWHKITSENDIQILQQDLTELDQWSVT